MAQMEEERLKALKIELDKFYSLSVDTCTFVPASLPVVANRHANLSASSFVQARTLAEGAEEKVES